MVISDVLGTNAVFMWLVFLSQPNHVMRDLMFVVCLYLFPNKLILLPSNSLFQQVEVVTRARGKISDKQKKILASSL